MTSLQLVVQNSDGDAFSVDIQGDLIKLGRSSNADIRLPYSTISGHHMTLENRDGVYHLSDAGSTNGTFVAGRQLEQGEAVPIVQEITVDVLTTRLIFRPSARVAQFTMEESGTLARKLLADAIDAPEEDDAFFEVLSGDRFGERIRIEQSMTIGPDGDIQTAGASATVERFGEGFAISGDATVNGSPISGNTRLKSKDRVTVGDVGLLFFDPLEAYFSDLEGPASVSVAAPVSNAPNTPAEEIAPELEPKTGWSAVEWVLLIIALGLLVGGIVAIVFVATA